MYARARARVCVCCCYATLDYRERIDARRLITIRRRRRRRNGTVTRIPADTGATRRTIPLLAEPPPSNFAAPHGSRGLEEAQEGGRRH